MSHTTSIKGITLQDMQVLGRAIDKLREQGTNVNLTQGGRPRAYYENQQGMGDADYVINLPNARYDIGLYKQADGSYEPRTDFFGGSVEKELGVTPLDPKDREKAQQAKLGKLFQMYGIVAATEKARKQGYSVRQVAGTDGQVKLVVTGFA